MMENALANAMSHVTVVFDFGENDL